MPPSLRLSSATLNRYENSSNESRELRTRRSNPALQEPAASVMTRRASGTHNGANGSSAYLVEPSSEDLGGYSMANGERTILVDGVTYVQEPADEDAEGEPDTAPPSEAISPSKSDNANYYLDDDDEDDDPIPTSKKGKGKVKAKSDSDSEYADEPEPVEEEYAPSDDADDGYGRQKKRKSTSASKVLNTRASRSRFVAGSSDDEKPIRTNRSKVNKAMRGFVADDDEEDDEMLDLHAEYNPMPLVKREVDPETRRRRHEAKLKELETKKLRKLAEEANPVPQPASGTLGPPKPKARQTRNSLAALEDDEYSDDDSQDVRKYALRDKRREVNYDVAAQFSRFGVVTEEEREKHKKAKAKAKSRSKIDRGDGTDGMNGLPFSMSGAQLSRIFGEQDGDSSDSDRGPVTNTTPRKSAAARMFNTGMLPSGGGLYAGPPGLMNEMGGPSNFGRVSGTNNLADVDPLLPASTISFDKVGGLDSHIQQLKEMVALPLLYPEVFQRFNITPPRGVLFHGPPGTGKTLLARALAASCSTETQRIAFFMRKGADCLSKWVGEAERQLRLLFEEAKNSQPSIIFFDEIDGLAPVRSSKQEQIHASIVSTLLALMDGMDGRGQVIVIGATNRPDAIDPALRRPGRFDREFYFPLPNRDARRKILDIHTSGWEPPLQEDFKDELAAMTKGYGGADLRALCTESALNAVQRRYPQIYKSNDRLLIDPKTIEVSARDFVISAQKLIPSSARSTSSVAIQLPAHFAPLLGDALEQAKTTLAKILPEVKRINLIEEAEFEEPSNAGFAQEKLMQTFERLRVFKPRLLICGESGLGQATLGPAILHHLEGFHVQSLDLGTLVSDSTRSLEAACVQIFTEARRHKPSIIYIPSLLAWVDAVTDSVKATVQGLLDAIDSADPILLLAVVEGSFRDLPTDIRSWFGFLKQNRIVLEKPSSRQRRAFFADLFTSIQRPPTQYPDAMPRKRRILADLPKAPPPKPRELNEAELQQQAQQDARVREYLKFRLAPVLTELRKRYKKFVKPIGEPGLTPAEIEARPKPARPEGLHSDVEYFARRPDGYGQFDEDDEESVDYDAMDVQPEPDMPTPQSEEEVHIAPIVETTAPSEADVETESELAPAPAPVAIVATIAEASAAPHVNGDVSMVESEPIAVLEAASSPAVLVADESAPQQPASDAIAVDMISRADGAVSEAVPVESTAPSRRFHDIDLEQMQHNLYYDNYLTPQDFISDLQLIVENAELEGESEQLGRAFAMLNHAHIILDQAFDYNFRMECQRMAQRQEQRRAKAKGTDDTLVATTQEDASDSTKDVEAPADRPLKRARSGEPHAGESTEDDEARKRARLSEAAVLQGDGNFEAGVADNALMPGVLGEPGRPIMGADLGLDVQPPTGPVPPERMPTPEPLPPFVVPPLDALERSLDSATDGLNVDALDQLRAACYDLVWHARAHWDRTALVADLGELVVDFTDEAKAATRDVE